MCALKLCTVMGPHTSSASVEINCEFSTETRFNWIGSIQLWAIFYYRSTTTMRRMPTVGGAWNENRKCCLSVWFAYIRIAIKRCVSEWVRVESSCFIIWSIVMSNIRKIELQFRRKIKYRGEKRGIATNLPILFWKLNFPRSTWNTLTAFRVFGN